MEIKNNECEYITAFIKPLLEQGLGVSIQKEEGFFVFNAFNTKIKTQKAQIKDSFDIEKQRYTSYSGSIDGKQLAEELSAIPS